MRIRELLTIELEKTIHSLWPDVALPLAQVGYPPQPEFGDFSSSCALQLAGPIGRPPREVAEMIVANFPKLNEVAKVQIEGAGFVNITLSDAVLLAGEKEILKKGAQYSQQYRKDPGHIIVEFISANPTGPLTLANGRGGFFGDILVNVLSKIGHVVEREYYVNDAGNQVNILAESVLRKHLSQNGIPSTYPDYCYQGAYVDELARALKIPNYNIAKNSLEDIRDKIKDKIVQKMLKDIKHVIENKMGISFTTFFSEQSLYAPDGPIDKTLQAIKEKNFVYESDGALWLKTSEYGDDKDRVLKKSDGTLTYLVPDIAYHLNKLETRGFDRAITVVGADHHGYIGRMYAAMDMFGHKGQVELVVMQMIRLLRDGQEVRMSKRSGTYVTIEELIDEVGIDATRYFFLMHAASSHMDFNLELAKEKSEKNPVYYVQYAHARMCSILRVAESQGKFFQRTATVSTYSRRLLVQMMRWPDVLEDVARDMSVHQIPQFAYDLATAFHVWYTKERVVQDDGTVNKSLLELVQASQLIFQDILTVMGISAPTHME